MGERSVRGKGGSREQGADDLKDARRCPQGTLLPPHSLNDPPTTHTQFTHTWPTMSIIPNSSPSVSPIDPPPHFVHTHLADDEHHPEQQPQCPEVDPAHDLAQVRGDVGEEEKAWEGGRRRSKGGGW